MDCIKSKLKCSVAVYSYCFTVSLVPKSQDLIINRKTQLNSTSPSSTTFLWSSDPLLRTSLHGLSLQLLYPFCNNSIFIKANLLTRRHVTSPSSLSRLHTELPTFQEQSQMHIYFFLCLNGELSWNDYFTLRNLLCVWEQQQRGTGSRLSTKTECFSYDDEKENAFK